MNRDRNQETSHEHTWHDPCPTPVPTTRATAGGFGPAIEGGAESDEHGYFWVGNGEYSSRVNYCPSCGQRAPRGATE